jgi:hypothetical protein
MAKYTGQITLRFWTEATEPEQVEQRLHIMFDKWDLATDKDIKWDDIDWTIEDEEDN